MDDDNSFASADKFDEKTLSLQNRPQPLNDIKEKISKLESSQKLSNFDMAELKNLLSFVLQEEKFDIKCYQTDKALTYLDFLR